MKRAITNKMSTLKQKKAVARLLENRGNVSKSMKEAGYSDAMAKNPQVFTRSVGFQEEAASFLKDIIKERNRLIAEMTTRQLTKVQYKDMTDCMDKLTKNIQLLSGGKTANDAITIGWEQ